MVRRSRDVEAGVQRVVSELSPASRRQTWEEFVEDLLSRHRETPQWVAERGAPSKSTIVGTILSDIHFEESVVPDQIFGLNEYSPEIAAVRLQRYFNGVPRIAKEVLSGLNHRGVTIVLGGDNFSGTIHEELAETNVLTSPQAILRLSALLSAGIKLLAEEFGRVHVVGVPGNHSRLSKKHRYKGTALHNLDWLLYGMVQRDLESDQRVTWQISSGTDVLFSMFGWRFLATHGDQARGGKGVVTGMYGPLLGLLARRRKWAAQTGNTFDYMLLGHWHYHDKVGPVIANGSVVGYNEYAQQGSLDFQTPQQAFWVTHPLRGVTYHTPVFLEPPQGPPRLKEAL